MFCNLIPVSMATGTWNISTLLNGIKTQMETWGSTALTIIGIILVVVGGYKIAKGLMSHGKGDVNWFMTIAMIVVGAFLAITSGGNAFEALGNLGAGGVRTIEGLGGATILLSLLG